MINIRLHSHSGTLSPCPEAGPRLQDEVFHVPQTQQYCSGNWTTWDHKITTLPGTYAVGAAYGSLLQLAGLVRMQLLRGAEVVGC